MSMRQTQFGLIAVQHCFGGRGMVAHARKVVALMTIWNRLNCALGMHQPLRRKVEWDGFNYVGACRHCGAALRRVGKHRWRLDRGVPRNSNLVRPSEQD
ncbi:MAG: hypothetical protein V2I27_12495 [Erythrobacter sp.]|jgi:hypothetical protein|nr:hypothetical protein [Erythrobacter sp.]